MDTYTVQQAKDEIKASIAVYLKKDADGAYRMREVNRLPFFLVGKPGVGKTEMARQIADEMNIGFVSLSITHHTRNTVLGLPVIREIADERKNSYTEYTMSEMIAMVEKKVAEGYREGILLIDEFACMAESLVAPMLAFLQTKNIGTHFLPEGWVLILCSNPSKYNRSARTFDMAVMDRVRRMEIVFDTGEFLKYGEEKGFHEDILEYLKLFPQDAHVCEVADTGERTIVTTRGWENLSWCLQGYEEADQTVSRALIAQFIKSEEIAERFYQFYLSNHTGLKVKEIGEILQGKDIGIYVDRMKEKPYAVRFQVMRLVGDVFEQKCREIGGITEFLMYLEEVSKNLEDIVKFSVDDMIEERLMGAPLGEKYLKRELDDREREAWREIRKLMDGYSLSMQSDDPENAEIHCLRNVLENYRKREAESLRKTQQEISDEVSNACSFIAAIEGSEELMDSFVNLLNQNEGFLDVMTAVKNPLYLKYSRRAYGTDSFLKRTAEQAG